MIKRSFFIIFLFACKIALSQTATDTIIQPDTPKIAPIVHRQVLRKKPHSLRADSILRIAKKDSVFSFLKPGNPINFTALANSQLASPDQWLEDSFKYNRHPYFRFTGPLPLAASIKQWYGKEDIFYSLIAVLIFFALIKNGFYRYVMDLFRIFFRTSVRQRQIKDQLIQSPLPSLLLNVLFIISGGLFLDILLNNFKMGTQFDFWLLFLYCALGLIIIYGVKFITLKFFGWVFQVSETVDTYIFIVFTTNKVVGIFLLPFVVILSFSFGLLHDVSITLSITMVVAFFVYRYFLSYVSLQRQLKISFFHFALYFFAFEIAPVLLINKLLFRFLIERP